MSLLKNILKEAQSEQQLDKFIGLLESGDWIFRKPLLYRGSQTTEIDTFNIRRGRERRGARDTSKIIENLVNCIHDVLIPNFPDRKQSVFTTSTESNAEKYGGYVYLVIPSKHAVISHIDHDPWWDFFRNAKKYGKRLKDISIDSEIDSTDSEIRKQYSDLAYAFQYALRGDCTELKYYNNTYGDPFENPVAFFKKLDRELDEFEVTAFTSNLKNLVMMLHQYYSNLEDGYPANKYDFYECVIQGDYLYVNYQWYLEHSDEINKYLK